MCLFPYAYRGGGMFGVFKHPLWVKTGIGVFKHSPLDLVLACLLVREVGDVLLDTPTHTWKIDHQILTKEREGVGVPPPPLPLPNHNEKLTNVRFTVINYRKTFTFLYLIGTTFWCFFTSFLTQPSNISDVTVMFVLCALFLAMVLYEILFTFLSHQNGNWSEMEKKCGWSLVHIKYTRWTPWFLFFEISLERDPM